MPKNRRAQVGTLIDPERHPVVSSRLLNMSDLFLIVLGSQFDPDSEEDQGPQIHLHLGSPRGNWQA